MPNIPLRLSLAVMLMIGSGSCVDARAQSDAPSGQGGTIVPSGGPQRELVYRDANRIEGTAQALARLQARWRERGSHPFIVAHFGDSHVQNGHLSDAAREQLQRIGGDAGRGMIYPYAIARTYSQNDYTSAFTGTWRTANSMQQPPRMPVGVSGFVAQTTDASATFSFAFTRPIAPGQMRVRLYYRMTAPGASISLATAGFDRTVPLAQTAAGTIGHVDVTVPAIGASLGFVLSNPSGLPAAPVGLAGAGAPPPFDPTIAFGSFELHGVSLERPVPGVLYHNLGVGGAAFSALTEQRYFNAQIDDLAPDLAILDWGTNDILYNNRVAAGFEATVLASIARLRASAPNAVILLTSSQDMNFRSRNITAAAELSQLLRRIAAEQDCLFYDWYAVSGGGGNMVNWVGAGLGRRDNIHLSTAGYRLKGQLLGEALVEALSVPASTAAATQ